MAVPSFNSLAEELVLCKRREKSRLHYGRVDQASAASRSPADKKQRSRHPFRPDRVVPTPIEQLACRGFTTPAATMEDHFSRILDASATGR